MLSNDILGGRGERKRKPSLTLPSDEQLIQRAPLSVTDEMTKTFYSGKTVLVTGGGGSVGSELSRKIAECAPRRLVILDVYENNAYDIQQELLGIYGDRLDLVIEIGSVQDRARLNAVFARHRPEIVFHAAAHKHVPLMEDNCTEAVKNNCIGTYNTADMAEKYGAERFILISTDKAVNPTNVMGASKRMCEMIVQSRADSRTAFCAVRFCNVIGSAGSVIPLFKRQIESGGPVTVTDKRVTRYFMTLSEAAGLLMQAGAQARRGELFVLDAGEPIRIYDLALHIISLFGLVPFVDIDVKEIGLRPGEKLYEELLIKDSAVRTENDMIFVERDVPHERREIEDKLSVLSDAVKKAEQDGDQDIVKNAFRTVVPTFHAPKEVNSRADTKGNITEADTAALV